MSSVSQGTRSAGRRNAGREVRFEGAAAGGAGAAGTARAARAARQAAAAEAARAGNPGVRGANPGANPNGNPGAEPNDNPGANPGGNPGGNPDGNPGGNPDGNPEGNPHGVNKPVSMQQSFFDFLVNVLGFNQSKVDCMSDEGYDDFADLFDMTYDQIERWTSNLSKRSRGTVSWGNVYVRRLIGTAHWINESTLQGLELDPNAMNRADVNDYYTAAQMQHASTPVMTDKPEQFEPTKWQEWSLKLENYLRQKSNARGIPLVYVIRHGLQPIDMSLESSDTRKIWNAQLTGPAYEIDDKEVHSLLIQLIVGTAGEAWIKGEKSGRGAMNALRRYYDGAQEGVRRTETARTRITNLFYKVETALPFSTYCTNITAQYKILEEEGEPEHERVKVQTFLDGIKSDNRRILTAVSVARMTPTISADLQTAIQHLSKEVHAVYPAGIGSRRRGGREISSIGRGGRGGGRGRGRGGGRGRGRGRGRGGGDNNVDLTKYLDGTETYIPPRIWNSLSQQQINMLNNSARRKEAIRIAKRQRRGQGGDDDGRSVSAVSFSGDQFNALMNGVIAGSRTNAAASTAGDDGEDTDENGPPGSVHIRGSNASASASSWDSRGRKRGRQS